MQVRNRISLLALSLTFGLANASPGYAEYRVTIVGPANSAPTGINSAGAVVGNYPTSSTTFRSFVNWGKGAVPLGTLGGTSTFVVGINDKGQVLGNWTNSGGEQRGFVYYKGTRRDIGTIPGRATRYVDINNAGYILAAGGPPPSDPFGPSPFGFLRSPGGTFQNIGTLPFPNAITQVEALNNRNQVTGESGTFLLPELPFHAFVWRAGVMRNLGNFGFTPNYGLDINDRGQVAGYTATGTFREALATVFSKGRPVRIDTRPPGTYRFSVGDAINNHGHVVGSSNHLGAYLYRGKRMQSLNALIDPKSGWNITFPRAINDAGQIAANGFRGGVEYTVRLDLIRPHALGAPHLEDEGADAAAQ
ncbi:HAF repeat-containing protein [Massilia sp. CMS3.1]|uniref:HAF repeat-containing protein n=1 Tax=Massilia sp. CMS3.1 TaxID=3373083 RepID=UPI003EE5A7FE